MPRSARPARPAPLPSLLTVAVAAALVLAACGSAPSAESRSDGSAALSAATNDPEPGAGDTSDSTPSPAPTRRRTASVVAVGDVACAPGQRSTRTTCRQADTAALTTRLDPAAIIGLGDLQYESGALPEYLGSYDETWGPLLARTLPVPGNHDYRTSGAAGYADYFEGSPGVDAEPDQPYVRTLAGWRIYLLDSNCELIDCRAEARWLVRDLRRNPARCALVAQHHPRWSTGDHGNQRLVQPLWRAAVANGVDVALAGHDHDYERFAPRGRRGAVTGSGMRSFVVGTGGKSFYGFGSRDRSSRFRQNTRFGVLQLRLSPRRYTWRFVATSGRVLDRGRSTCG